MERKPEVDSAEHIKFAIELVEGIIQRPEMYLRKHADLEEIAMMMHGFDAAGVAYKKCAVRGNVPLTFGYAFHTYTMGLFPDEGSAKGWAHIIRSRAMKDCPPDPTSKGSWDQDWFLFKQVFEGFKELHREEP